VICQIFSKDIPGKIAAGSGFQSRNKKCSAPGSVPENGADVFL
jgi:hypothetical protein